MPEQMIVITIGNLNGTKGIDLDSRIGEKVRVTLGKNEYYQHNRRIVCGPGESVQFVKHEDGGIDVKILDD